MTYDNVLAFMKLKDFSVRTFESNVDLPNGTFQAAKAKKEFSGKTVDKIVEVFSTDLKRAGFEIVDLKPLGKDERLILTPEQKERLAETLGVQAPKSQDVKKLEKKIEDLQADRLESLKEDKAFLQEILRTGLGRIVDVQGTILAYQKAWVDQMAEDKANGDQALEKKLKARMSRRVGEHELGPVNRGNREVPNT